MAILLATVQSRMFATHSTDRFEQRKSRDLGVRINRHPNLIKV